MLNIPFLGLVSMNTKILLGLTLVAVLAMTIASPAVADAITGIKKTDVKVKNDEINLKFHLEDKVPKTPFGGYALFTNGGAVIAITSHAGFFDSTGQQAPTASQIAQPVGAIGAVCTVTDVACGNEWHAHLVEPVLGDPICTGVGGIASIGDLTYNQPTDKLKIKGKHIEAKGIDIGTEGFVGALSGTLHDITVGTPGGSAAFDLVPVDVNGVPIAVATDLAAVCIVPTA